MGGSRSVRHRPTSPSSGHGSSIPFGSPRSAVSSRTRPHERRPATRLLVAARRRRAPVACLATTFHLRSRLLHSGLPVAVPQPVDRTSEGDRISSIAAVLEEEDRLSEAQVSVLVDRSSPAEKRNLRWDVLPVGVPGGLLHAKVAALLWERSARIILGSANLTSAGYRRQVELALDDRPR